VVNFYVLKLYFFLKNIWENRFKKERGPEILEASTGAQGCGSGSGLDPDSETLWIRIRIGNPDPDPGARKL
jgi:hypothetical protein